MTLSEFVLTYTGEGTEPIVSIADYYDKFVKPRSSAYSRGSLLTSSTAVCCFHDDIEPSLGLVNHKHLKGVKVFHCFGCGLAGDVINFHQRFEYTFNKRRITYEESAFELCKIYGLNAEQFKNIDEKELQRSAYIDKMKKINAQMDSYTISEFSDDIIKARGTSLAVKKKKSIIGNACIKMTASVKKLYDEV